MHPRHTASRDTVPGRSVGSEDIAQCVQRLLAFWPDREGVEQGACNPLVQVGQEGFVLVAMSSGFSPDDRIGDKRDLTLVVY